MDICERARLFQRAVIYDTLVPLIARGSAAAPTVQALTESLLNKFSSTNFTNHLAAIALDGVLQLARAVHGISSMVNGHAMPTDDKTVKAMQSLTKSSGSTSLLVQQAIRQTNSYCKKQYAFATWCTAWLQYKQPLESSESALKAGVERPDLALDALRTAVGAIPVWRDALHAGLQTNAYRLIDLCNVAFARATDEVEALVKVHIEKLLAAADSEEKVSNVFGIVEIARWGPATWMEIARNKQLLVQAKDARAAVIKADSEVEKDKPDSILGFVTAMRQFMPFRETGDESIMDVLRAQYTELEAALIALLKADVNTPSKCIAPLMEALAEMEVCLTISKTNIDANRAVLQSPFDMQKLVYLRKLLVLRGYIASTDSEDLTCQDWPHVLCAKEACLESSENENESYIEWRTEVGETILSTYTTHMSDLRDRAAKKIYERIQKASTSMVPFVGGLRNASWKAELNDDSGLNVVIDAGKKLLYGKDAADAVNCYKTLRQDHVWREELHECLPILEKLDAQAHESVAIAKSVEEEASAMTMEANMLTIITDSKSTMPVKRRKMQAVVEKVSKAKLKEKIHPSLYKSATEMDVVVSLSSGLCFESPLSSLLTLLPNGRLARLMDQKLSWFPDFSLEALVVNPLWVLSAVLGLLASFPIVSECLFVVASTLNAIQQVERFAVGLLRCNAALSESMPTSAWAWSVTCLTRVWAIHG
eukprot:6492799-Amphidinium_carterae.1